jgi:DNA-binding response OmpR family regulator
MKILLVEDEPDLGAIIQNSLSHHQYVVDWVVDGQAGWEYLTHERTTYSLAIVDWMLPKLSGKIHPPHSDAHRQRSDGR